MLKTSASFYVLLALSKGPCHGLGIAEDVAEFTKGEVILGPGTLYKCLKGLADAGSIARVHVHVDDPEGTSHRKHYRITASGTAELKRMLVGLNRAMAVGKARVGVPQGA